jgi:hypothetical protein
MLEHAYVLCKLRYETNERTIASGSRMGKGRGPLLSESESGGRPQPAPVHRLRSRGDTVPVFQGILYSQECQCVQHPVIVFYY